MSPTGPTQQIPVVVLAGFLGSGKTTLLNHLLRASRGTRIGAIVNDFGSIEIDAMTVAGQLGDSTLSLGNGCLCCAVDASELDVYLEKLTRPAARLDVVVIEASGLAEPQELVRMVLASENPRVVYGGLVEVVDAAEYEETRERHPEIARHLAVADLVVLNKTDRVPRAALDRLRASLGGAASVVESVYGRVDPELFFDRRPSTERVGQLAFEDLLDDDEGHDGEHGEGHGEACGPGCGHPGHLHHAYESVAFTSAAPMEPRRLMAFLDSRPEGLYRLKGFVDFGAADPRNRYGVHAVGRFLRFYPEPWPPGEERVTQLVLIGSGIDAEGLRKSLDAAVDPAPRDTPDEAAMWGVLRYVQRDEAEEADEADEADGSSEALGAEE
ncbi:cobalamin biosynthesis protein CobW [Streptomyces sp. ERV7]|uniref:CobW family GTP-binding protein n=1 Tax=Streptomyces sp. ERV7 TaxID=1322334 RepID=UPI0007F41C4D|nr:GTP-binding protein [Streptomyces sp. ERV7]OAR22524.1 cobalamin biosynthesis protein CobW [Streptomyces sp. ERV7]